MGGVREFRKEDIPAVADLWLRVFRDREVSPPKALLEYFDEIFFEAPWFDPSLPSLVYHDDANGIVGFLGVVPRRMKFQKEPLKVAVATQLAEDENGRSAYAAVKLVKSFFAGPQDLSFSDGANEASERLWHASGGQVALLYSLDWTRVLRPAQYARVLLDGRKRQVPFARLLPPLCVAFDTLVLKSQLGSYWHPEAADAPAEDDPSDEALLACVQQFSADRMLQPEYDLQTFRWLLGQAENKKMYGRLRRRIVREPGGEVAGWYLYYVEPGQVSEVLQFGGRPKAIRMVLSDLIADAWKHGAVAVSGEMEPRFAKELGKERCGFAWTGGVLAQSRRPEILQSIQLGDAFLSRLEGEWWARFSDPEWTAY